MDTISLKKYIYINNKVEYILQEIGCHHIKYHPTANYYSCGNYNGDNISSINVKNNEYLNVINWTRQEFDKNADIITLVQYNKQLSFSETIKYIHNILNINYQWQYFVKNHHDKDARAWYEKYTYTVDVSRIHPLDEKLLNDYIPMLYIGWLREGIMPWTAKKFGIAYSYRRNRIIIPHRYWLTGELLGVNARTTIADYDIFGIQKYWITPTYKKSLNIYGLWEHKNAIQRAGFVVVYESEKSVLKMDSRHNISPKNSLEEDNYDACVAISGHSLSEEQVRILVGLNVDIVISMDKDVSINEVRHMCNKFYGIRNVYYTLDTDNLLDDKESVADKPKRVIDRIMEQKVLYDENEHQKYLELFNKHKKK